MKGLVFGEIIWDVYPDRACIGGAPLNFAAHSAQLGGEVSLLSAVGRDRLGDEAIGILGKWAVGCDLVRRSDLPTGRCMVTVDGTGAPSYRVLTDAAYDRIELTDAEITDLCAGQYDILYFGTLAQRSESRYALEKLLDACAFEEVFCDLNLRPDCYDRRSVENCLAHATLLKFSDEEAPLLCAVADIEAETQDDLASTLFSRYPQLKIILLTLGGEGACAYERKGDEVIRSFAPAECVEVVSTVGAGDSFSAAWLAAYRAGDSVECALRKANHRAAWVVSHAEALPDPDRFDEKEEKTDVR